MKNQTLAYHLLPTEDATFLNIDKLGILDFWKDGKKVYTNQHLYLTSDAPIKEGEEGYVYHPDGYIKKSTGYEFQSDKRDGCKKIELTTDPKLIADGVPAIDGNTKAIDLHRTTIKTEVYFLPEFVMRYNQKDNQKVDVEKLAKEFTGYEKGTFEYNVATINFKAGYNQALQSQAGLLNLGDVRKIVSDAVHCYRDVKITMNIGEWVDNQIEHLLTKSQPKGDIVIELNEGNIYFK